jgi:hypothetical protein
MQQRRTHRRRDRAIAWSGALAGALALVSAAHGAITAPALELVRAQAVRASSGIWLRLDGTFPLGDLVQQPLELEVLIREAGASGRFVRFVLPVGGFEGSSPALADGFGAADVDAVAAASQPSQAARLLELASGRIEVRLPSAFPSGPAEAHLYLVYRGEPLLSNPLPFEIAGGTP